jgi:hypothetical protein
MPKHRHLARTDIMPASFVRALQEFISPMIQAPVRPYSAAQLIVGAGDTDPMYTAGPGRAAADIGGQWRWSDSLLSMAAPSAGGTYALYATTDPDPATGFAITSRFAVDGPPAGFSRLLATFSFDGNRISGLTPVYGAEVESLLTDQWRTVWTGAIRGVGSLSGVSALFPFATEPRRSAAGTNFSNLVNFFAADWGYGPYGSLRKPLFRIVAVYSTNADLGVMFSGPRLATYTLTPGASGVSNSYGIGSTVAGTGAPLVSMPVSARTVAVTPEFPFPADGFYYVASSLAKNGSGGPNPQFEVFAALQARHPISY